MRRASLFLLMLTLFVAACAGASAVPLSGAQDVLKITGQGTEKSYTAEDLRALEAAQASFRDIAYTGVPLAVLLRDAGFDPQAVKAVKAVAVDGFSANYDAELVNRPDSLVAYAQEGGPLVEEEAPFRMVLPDQEGKLNVRQLVEIQVIP
jgi:DMSO/TMAO reductase YedYZ molybdopterin-dependent catalytic subunit